MVGVPMGFDFPLQTRQGRQGPDGADIAVNPTTSSVTVAEGEVVIVLGGKRSTGSNN